jgi:alpha-tubulin suppressor-like RCC1 family protein
MLGQLGDGTTIDSGVPVAAGGATDWTAISAGGAFSCGLRAGGLRSCWGNGGLGQLGMGDKNDALAPVAKGDKGWVGISAGMRHACAIQGDGRLFCWGDDEWGAVGAGGATEVLSPVEPYPGKTWRAVSASVDYTCAIAEPGTISCWGLSAWWPTFEVIDETPVGTDADWVDLSAGEYDLCAIKRDGSLWCVGSNSDGVLGQGDLRDDVADFLRVGTRNDWARVSVGAFQACAVTTGGELYCWGDGTQGELGVPIGAKSAIVTAPMRVAPGTTWVDVACGGSHYDIASEAHTCARAANGDVFCWGNDYKGEVGDGKPHTRTAVPVAMDTATDWAELGGEGVGRKTDGSIWKWDTQAVLHVNQGSSERDNLVYVTKPYDTGFKALAGGLDRGGECTLDASGRAGCPYVPYLSIPDASSLFEPWSPLPVATQTGFTRLASGSRGSSYCALDAAGALFCWGDNYSGNLGDGTKTDVAAPTAISPGAAWASISMGDSHTCGVRTDGSLWCWGDAFYGQTGHGDTAETLVPTRVGTDTDWASVAVHWGASCGLKKNGALFCWGEGDLVGNGGTTNQTSPVPIGAGTWTRVAGGYLHMCGIRSDGTLWCWGFDYNTTGQGDAVMPAQIGTDHDWVDVTAATYQSCGLRAGGRLYCWGEVDHGLRETPVKVL